VLCCKFNAAAAAAALTSPPLPLQVCVLDGKRYKEANPANSSSLGFEALSPCILDKPLLKWEAGSETPVVALHMEVSRYMNGNKATNRCWLTPSKPCI
jgi:hypothetical protein